MERCSRQWRRWLRKIRFPSPHHEWSPLQGPCSEPENPRSDIVVSERSLPLELKRALADTTAETSCECQEHESRRLFTFCFYWEARQSSAMPFRRAMPAARHLRRKRTRQQFSRADRPRCNPENYRTQSRISGRCWKWIPNRGPRTAISASFTCVASNGIRLSAPFKRLSAWRRKLLVYGSILA